MADQPRRPRTLNDARTEAEAAFKKTTTKVPEAPPKKTEGTVVGDTDVLLGFILRTQAACDLFGLVKDILGGKAGQFEVLP